MTDPISAVFAAPNAAVAPPTVSKSRAVASDFETFLKMLTAQLKNQDPSNPVDSSDYAAQLAAFSSVEQQVQTNDLLKSLAAQLGVSGIAQMGAWVGMEARSPAARGFDGTSPITLATETAVTADRAELVVTSPSGREVQRIDLPARGGPVQWSGRDEFGAPLMAGLYGFSVESYLGETLLGSAPVQSFSRIVEARIENGQTVLVTDEGAMIAADSVTAMRDPG